MILMDLYHKFADMHLHFQSSIVYFLRYDLFYFLFLLLLFLLHLLLLSCDSSECTWESYV